MTRPLSIAGMAMWMVMSGLHAAEPQIKDPAVEMEARKASITNLETHIAQREQRLVEWSRDIVDLDARIEKRVDELVKMLAGMRDSGDSRMQVSQLKHEAIEGLKRGMDRYVQKRKEIREAVRVGETSALGDLDRFDARIIRRVDQIAELTKSIPMHQDVDKYKTDGGSYWNGYYYENTRISEDWKQNRRDNVQSDKQRAETNKTLKDGLKRLDQRKRSLKDLLANRELTDSARMLYTRELGQVDAYEDHLNAQLRDMASGSSGGGRAVSSEQANEVEDLIDDARKDLREDVARLFRSYDQFASGRSQVEAMKKNLSERKAWLEQHAPATGAQP